AAQAVGIRRRRQASLARGTARGCGGHRPNVRRRHRGRSLCNERHERRPLRRALKPAGVEADVTSWDPNPYLKFADHRLRPALDPLARIQIEEPGAVFDLGCGAGNVTKLLAERWPKARVTGVDSSMPMLEKARAAAPRIAFLHAELGVWHAGELAGVIYS